MSKTSDLVQLAKHLSFHRVLNITKLYSSFLISRIIKKPIVWGMPFTVSIEPTTACNLSCPECPSGKKEFTRDTGKISVNDNEFLLASLGKQVMYINYYFQGEPFLHPSFLDLIVAAKKKGIYTATSTNAHFISEDKASEIVKSGLDRLIISIDGVTQETYESYRIAGKLIKVIDASKALVNAKKKHRSKTPHLIFQFLVVQQNEHEIPALELLANELGIDEVRYKSAQVYDYKFGHPLIPKSEKYARYTLQKDGTYVLKYKTGNHCWRMWSSCVFTWDAQVVPCCFDKDASYTLGSALKMPFRDIWRSNRYHQFRMNVLNKRNQIDICQNCSEGTKVWL